MTIPGRDRRLLAGTLTIPATGLPPFSVALTLTGSGTHLRDGNRTPDHPYCPFRQIAAALAARGVATLRLDDRGVGESTGDAGMATGDDTADDARVAVAWLREQAGIDPGASPSSGTASGARWRLWWPRTTRGWRRWC